MTDNNNTVDENQPLPDSVFLESADLTAETGSNTVETASVVQPEKKGYMSYDEWKAAGRDPDEFKGAKAYEKEGERFKALMSTQSKVKELEDTVVRLAEYNKRVETMSYERAKEELKTQAMEAASLGEVDKVKNITDKIFALEEGRQATAKVESVQTSNVSPDELFATNNPWYSNPQSDSDYQKIGFAMQEDKRISQEFGKLPVEQHLAILSQRINKKFESTMTTRSTPVVSSSEHEGGAATNNFKAVFDKLPRDHQLIVQTLKQRDKNFSLKDLKAYAERVNKYGV